MFELRLRQSSQFILVSVDSLAQKPQQKHINLPLMWIEWLSALRLIPILLFLSSSVTTNPGRARVNSSSMHICHRRIVDS